MKLKFFIEFSEKIENPSDIESEELSRIAYEVKKHLHKCLKLSGVNIHEDSVKLDFDLE